MNTNGVGEVTEGRAEVTLAELALVFVFYAASHRDDRRSTPGQQRIRGRATHVVATPERALSGRMLVVVESPSLANCGADACIEVAAERAFGAETEHGSALRRALIRVHRLPLTVRREVIDVVAVVISQARVGLLFGMVYQARSSVEDTSVLHSRVV